MSIVAPPTKPPRGIKNPKESSGHLMSIIRTLSASESNEQRDREKAKLEKEYNKSDQQLDELVVKHHQELSQVMQLFGQLSTRVSTSRDKIRSAKENLLACKTLLSCRREELKKLWLEGVEHKHVLHLLDEIEQIKDALTQVGSFLSRKHYLHATNLIVSTLALGEGDLAGVEALKELKSELNAKKQKLIEKLLEELNKYIYIDSTQEIVQLRRQGSGRDFNSSQQKISFLRQSKAKKMLEFTYNTDNKVDDKNLPVERVKEDITQDVEEDSTHFIAIILECLAILNKLPDTVEKLKIRMQAELFTLVHRTTEQLLPTIDSMTPQFALLELLQTLIEQFRRVVGAHQSVLALINRTAEFHGRLLTVYDNNDIWWRIQTVLQLLLTDYLDIQNTASENQPAPTSFSEQTMDISSYFNRKKLQRKEKPPLFKFDFAFTLPRMNSYIPEQQSGDLKLKFFGDPSHQEKILICPPDPQNITVIFIPLMKFIEEIELAVPGPYSLNVFLTNYVKGDFLRHHRSKVVNVVDAATKSSDAWRAITPPELVAQLNLSRPLLLSTVKVEESISELKSLMETIPHHAPHFLSMIINILKNYREICQAAYRGIVQPESEDKTIYSVSWLKDEDITRLLKSLPNWEQLEGWWQTICQRPGHITREESTVEGPEDVQIRNEREAEILASNLGESGISQHEIISDVNQLKCLAQLQESMEWFATQIIKFVNILSPKSSSSSHSRKNEPIPVIEINNFSNTPKIPPQLILSLEQLANEFQDLANTCLLVLHLEVRVQCFHFLLPHGVSTPHVSNSHDIDPRVSDFSRVLSSIDEAMTASIQPRKCKYIFEGLGHMIAKLLISSAQMMEKIDKTSIHRMCRNIYTLQQTLTNITMTREIALDHARHYFELFFLTPEDVLNQIVEKGAEFSEMEYMNALQLIHRSQTDQPAATIQGYLQKLSDILGNSPMRSLTSTSLSISGVAV